MEHEGAEEDVETTDEAVSGDEGEMEPLTSEQMLALHGHIDADKDGKLTLPEVVSYSRFMRQINAKKDSLSVVDTLDHDKDGKVSLTEVLKEMDSNIGEEGAHDKAEEERQKEMETARFKAADKNGDGLLDSEELPALFHPESDAVLEITVAATLKSKDTDGNGELSPAEFWIAEGSDDEDHSPDAKKADFAKLDLDKNGMLNLHELKAWDAGHFHDEEVMVRFFELADGDKDGMVTAAELEAIRELVAEEGAQDHLKEWVAHNEL